MFKALRLSTSLLFVLSILLSPMAWGQSAGGSAGGLYVRESLLYTHSTSSDANTGGAGSDTSQNILTSTSLGYVAFDWLYLGVTWNYYKESDNLTDNTGANQTTDTTFNEYGPTVGYIDSNWNILGTWFLLADKQWTVNNAAGNNAYGRTGGGFMIDLGYRFDLGGSFQVGPSLKYRNITWNNCKDPSTGSTSSCASSSAKTEDITPFFTLSFNFQ